jgi:hypothetical protein
MSFTFQKLPGVVEERSGWAVKDVQQYPDGAAKPDSGEIRE